MKLHVLGILGGAALVALAGACGSSSGGGNATTPDGGGSSSGGSSGGSSGSGSSSGGVSSSGSGSGGSSGSGSSSGGMNGGATQLATGITDIHSLTRVGSTLYWVSTGTPSSIQTVPVAGGTPSTILTEPNLLGDLTSDGTHLFYTAMGDGGVSADVVSVSLTGTGRTVLASEDFVVPDLPDGSQLFIVNANLYFPTTQGPAAVVASGGSGVTYLAQGAAVSGGTLLWVDSSGAYFVTQNGAAPAFASVPLAGGNVTTLAQPNAGPGGWAGDFVVMSGKAYYVEDSTSGLDSTLYEAPTPGGPAASLMTYAKQGGFTLLVDGTNLFAVEQRGDMHGIFRVDASTGALTSVWTPTLTGNNGPSGQATFDTGHFYFASESGGVFTLWSVPR